MVARNVERNTVEAFGDQWARFDQSSLSADHVTMFERYFGIFPWASLPAHATGFDLGCGSGRWARLVAPRVGTLHCIDPSEAALDVAGRNLREHGNCVLHKASVDQIPLPDESMDFGYSLGVLHHVPDTAAGLAACVRKLKPGAPFLVYLYYAFDNRPGWFRLIWRLTVPPRLLISKMPFGLRYGLSQMIAALSYFPLARSSLVLERLGWHVEHFPLSSHRDLSFYSMRTNALDRFGTRVEKRFTARQIRAMMERAHLEDITFSQTLPYWCAVGTKSHTGAPGDG